MGQKKSGTKRKARLLVADDHPLIREGLKRIIGLQADLELCGEAQSVNDVLETVAAKKPDLLLLDLHLGSGDGLELIKSLKASFPTLHILVLSQLDETVYAERTLRAGAQGFIMKEQPPAEVLNAIRVVLGGQLYVGQRLAAIALHKMLGQRPHKGTNHGHDVDKLTDRELQIFHLLGVELGVKKIAGELNLSVKTVETHRENIKHKRGFQSAAELARHATKWVRR